jgi:hypothetical protein
MSDRKRQCDDEVGEPVGKRCHTHCAAPHDERVDLCDQQPEDRTQSNRERCNVQHECPPVMSPSTFPKPTAIEGFHI